MRSRSFAANEATVIDPPVPNWADPGSRDEIHLSRFLRFAPPQIDAGLFMFALCKHLQMIYLDPRGIDFRLAADEGGRLPPAACRMLGFMVSEIVKDASECREAGIPRPAVNVTLHRRGTTYLFTISKRGLETRPESAQPGLLRVLDLARELPGHCLVRSMPARGTIALMFDADAIEQGFPAAIWRSRENEARHRAVRDPQ
jgi:hypothetical protein